MVQVVHFGWPDDRPVPGEIRSARGWILEDDEEIELDPRPQRRRRRKTSPVDRRAAANSPRDPRSENRDADRAA